MSKRGTASPRASHFYATAAWAGARLGVTSQGAAVIALRRPIRRFSPRRRGCAARLGSVLDVALARSIMRWFVVEVLAYDKCPLPNEARAFLGSCHLVVASAERDEEVRRDKAIDTALVEVGFDEPMVPSTQLVHLLEAVPNQWVPAVVALMTVDNPFFTPAEMMTGVVNRRINAILEMLDAPYCAHDVQGFFSEIVELVTDAAKNPTKATAAGLTRLTAAFGGGFAGGWFGFPLAGQIATNAVDWLFEEGGDLPQSVLEASKMALCYEALPREQASETGSEAAVRLAVGGTAYELAELIRIQGSAASPELKQAHRAWYGTYMLLGGNVGS